MILKIILLYLILNLLYIYNLKRRVVDYYIKSSTIFYKNAFFIFGYVIVFLGLFRVLRFFQENKILDLKFLFSIENILNFSMVFILVWLIKRFVVMYVKLNFFRIHYYLLSPNSNNTNINVFYLKFFLSKVYNPVVKYYKFINYINITLNVIIVILILKDLVSNNLILDQSLGFLKWYGVFKFFYIMIKFVATKQDLILDYYAYNYTYPGDCITGPFWDKLTTELDNELELKENKYRFEVIAK